LQGANFTGRFTNKGDIVDGHLPAEVLEGKPLHGWADILGGDVIISQADVRHPRIRAVKGAALFTDIFKTLPDHVMYRGENGGFDDGDEDDRLFAREQPQTGGGDFKRRGGFADFLGGFFQQGCGIILANLPGEMRVGGNLNAFQTEAGFQFLPEGFNAGVIRFREEGYKSVHGWNSCGADERSQCSIIIRIADKGKAFCSGEYSHSYLMLWTGNDDFRRHYLIRDAAGAQGCKTSLRFAVHLQSQSVALIIPVRTAVCKYYKNLRSG